ncbi:hypothetical protein ACFL4W_01865 [Planctomycetota bacterium]
MKIISVMLGIALICCLGCFPEPKPKEDMYVRLVGTNNDGFKSYETNKITYKMVAKSVRKLKKYKLSDSEEARLRIRHAPYATCKKGSTTISYRVPEKMGPGQTSRISIYDKDKKLDVRVYFMETEKSILKIEDRSVFYDGKYGEEIIDLTIKYLKMP